jgi:putative acetyltransferase
VRPDRQRRGIGTALIEAGLDRLREMGAEGSVLVGDPAYYCRFGFEVDVGISYGDLPPGLLQMLSFTDADAKGEVQYHASFNAA